MLKKEIRFKNFQDIQQFNKICSNCEYEVDLMQGKYIVDAKSIMGIFSLNVDEPVTVILNIDDQRELSQFEVFGKEETRYEYE